MNTNCLVTKLKAEVNNNRLHKVDEFFISVKAGNSIVINIDAGIMVPFKLVDGDGYIDTVGNVSKDSYTDATLVAVTTDALFTIGNKYNLIKFHLNTKKMDWEDGDYILNVSEMSYCTKLNHLIISGNSNTIGKPDFSRCPLTTFNYTFKNTPMTTAEIAAINPGNLQSLSLSGTTITGNLSELVGQTSLVYCHLNATQVTGELTVLLDAMKNVRTAGSTLVFSGNGIITYNGTPTVDGQNMTITFDGQGGYSVS